MARHAKTFWLVLDFLCWGALVYWGLTLLWGCVPYRIATPPPKLDQVSSRAGVTVQFYGLTPDGRELQVCQFEPDPYQLGCMNYDQFQREFERR